jgi:hypothetical protein
MSAAVVTFKSEAPVPADPRKDLLLNGSIDKLPKTCESMEELIHEVRKYSDNDSYFMQIFPLFLDRVFGETVMDNSHEVAWVRGDKGGWLRKAADSTRAGLTAQKSFDVTRRTDRSNAFMTQLDMSDFASRLLHLFVPEGSVSKMINDDHYRHHLLNTTFDVLPKKVKMKLQGLSAYNCIRSSSNHGMYDQWCQRSNTVASNLMTTPNQSQNSNILTTSTSNSRNIVVNLTLQNYFFVTFLRYPTVEEDVFPQRSKKGIVVNC